MPRLIIIALAFLFVPAIKAQRRAGRNARENVRNGLETVQWVFLDGIYSLTKPFRALAWRISDLTRRREPVRRRVIRGDFWDDPSDHYWSDNWSNRD